MYTQQSSNPEANGNAEHDANTTMLYFSDGILRVISSVGFLPPLALCANFKRLNFGLSRLENIFPMFTESPTYLLSNLCQNNSHLFRKAQLSCYGCSINTFPFWDVYCTAPLELPFISWLLWLMPSLASSRQSSIWIYHCPAGYLKLSLTFLLDRWSSWFCLFRYVL